MVKSTVTSLIRRFASGNLTRWAPVPPGICGATERCRNEGGGVCPDEGSKEVRKAKIEKFAAWCRFGLLRIDYSSRRRLFGSGRASPAPTGTKGFWPARIADQSAVWAGGEENSPDSVGALPEFACGNAKRARHKVVG